MVGKSGPDAVPSFLDSFSLDRNLGDGISGVVRTFEIDKYGRYFSFVI